MCSGKRFGFPIVLVILILVFSTAVAFANYREARPQRPLPTNLDTLQLESPVTVNGIGNIFNVSVPDRQSVIVQLTEKPVAAVVKTDRFSFTVQLTQRSRIYTEQLALIEAAERLDPDLLIFGKTRNALNAVMMEIDTAVIPQLAAHPGVVAIYPIVDYEIELTDTAVSNVATISQHSQYDGSGVSVAILDSGIDYHHIDLGGSGNPNDYQSNNPFLIEPGSFPTNKVVGGYDFVGSRWLTSDFGRNSLLRSDPDPIDLGTVAGHGTRIADVIGGKNGVAPGADLYAVRVCTSHTSACSGVALILGLDYVLDPNRDGYIDDAVDIISLSIQAKKNSVFDHTVHEALENISTAGVLAVGTAGNGLHEPYTVTAPGSAPTMLTVGAIVPGSPPSVLGSANYGPALLNDWIKPEIVASAIVETAVAGSGQARSVAGDTVTAVPIVAGNAALLMQAYPERSWQEIKALLTNNGQVNIHVSDLPDSAAAPVTQIGGGEVRLDAALNAMTTIWDASERGSTAVSFGFQEVSRNQIALRKQIRIQNYSNIPIRYNLSTTFRYEEDATNGAVSIWTPATINVPANSSVTFPLVMRINGYKLRDWPYLLSPNRLSSADIMRLGYDGYIWFDDSSTTQDDQSQRHLAWQVLPRRTGNVVLDLAQNDVVLRNNGITQVDVSTYSLIGVSGKRQMIDTQDAIAVPDLRYVGYTTTITEPGVCGDAGSFLLAFALNSWTTHRVPTNSYGSYKIDLDTDQDGLIDYSLVNRRSTLPDSWPGRAMSWILNWETDIASAHFYADADLQNGNTILYACSNQIGMNESDYFNPIDLQVSVLSETGEVVEIMDGITISPLGERFMATFTDGEPSMVLIPANANRVMDVLDFGFLTNNSETGLLILYNNGGNGRYAVAFEISP